MPNLTKLEIYLDLRTILKPIAAKKIDINGDKIVKKQYGKDSKDHKGFIFQKDILFFQDYYSNPEQDICREHRVHRFRPLPPVCRHSG